MIRLTISNLDLEHRRKNCSQSLAKKLAVFDKHMSSPEISSPRSIIFSSSFTNLGCRQHSASHRILGCASSLTELNSNNPQQLSSKDLQGYSRCGRPTQQPELTPLHFHFTLPSEISKMEPSSQTTESCQTTTKTVNCIEYRTKLFNKILPTYPIRKQPFHHLGAFDVSKFIYAAKVDDVVGNREKEYFLNPMRDLFTDSELRGLQGMISDELAIVVWGKNLKHLFDRVKDPMRYLRDRLAQTARCDHLYVPDWDNTKYGL